MPLDWIVICLAGCAGLAVGSFLNVCICRLPKGESVVKPRSHCGSCGSNVRWHDNVPVISYVVLRGRCRDCRNAFSWQYPAVEIATGLWFAFAFSGAAHALTATLPDLDRSLLALVHGASMALFGFLLLGLMAMDWQTGLLPNEFTVGGVCAGLFFAGAESFWVPSVRYKTFFTPEEVFFGRRLGAAILGFFLLWAIGQIYLLLRKRRGMGAGDAKMLAMVGAFVGYGGMGVALFCGIVLAGIAGIVVLLSRRGVMSSHVPFGSFLAVGGFVAAASGEPIVHWYFGLFR